MTAPVPKPIPEPDEASAPFWEGTAKGELRLMRCSDCGVYRLPSRAHCPSCIGEHFEWTAASGRGTVRSFGIMHQRYHPAFETPYNLAIVELEEGPRITTNIVGAELDQIRVDMPVVVEWEHHEDVTLPRFRPAG